MFSNFDKLLDMVKSYEPTTGSKCDSFGSNINTPTNSGLNDFNKGVAFMSSFGDHSVAINEAGESAPVKFKFDTHLLYDNLQPVEAFLKQELKKVNLEEIERNKHHKESDFGSAMGFMAGVDGDPNDEEQEAIKMMQYGEHDSKFPSQLSTDIDFNPDEFLKTLAQLYSKTNPEKAMAIVNSASSFIKKFGINSYRNYINRVKDEIKNRNYSSEERDPAFN